MSNDLLVPQLPEESKKQYDEFINYCESGYKSVKDYYERVGSEYTLGSLHVYSSRYHWVSRREEYLQVKMYLDNFENQVLLSKNYKETLPYLVDTRNQLVQALHNEARDSTCNIDSMNKHINVIDKLINIERRICNMDTVQVAIEQHVHREKEQEHRYDINDALAYINSLDTKDETAIDGEYTTKEKENE